MVQVIERELLFQPGHGFSVGTVLYSDPSSTATESQADLDLAQSDATLTLPIALVSDVPNADQYRVAHTGIIDFPAHGFTVSAPLFGSESTPGVLTETVPSIFKNAIAMATNPDQLVVVHFSLGGPTIPLPSTASKAIQSNNTTTFATKASIALAAVNANWVVRVAGVLRQSVQEKSAEVDIFETDSGVSLLNQTIQVVRGDEVPEQRASFSEDVFIDTLDTDSPVQGVGVRFRTSSAGNSFLSDVSFTPSLQSL